MVASSVSSGRSRNDVVYATRLPFDPGSSSAGSAQPERSTSYVEELWSPILALRSEIDRRKHTLIACVYFQRTALRSFSLRRGLNWIWNVSRWASPLVPTLGLVAFSTKKATRLGRPRLARYAARRLARTTPSEGGGEAGPVHRIEAMPARLDRGGRGRVGEERVVVESHQHRLNGCCRPGG
jgi:hypothetical protein